MNVSELNLRKHIYWRKDMSSSGKGKMFANVHLLVGYCPTTIAYFQALAEELRKTFPEAKDEDLYCGQVTKSHSVDGFTLLRWNAEIDKKEYKGFASHENGQPEYYFL